MIYSLDIKRHNWNTLWHPTWSNLLLPPPPHHPPVLALELQREHLSISCAYALHHRGIAGKNFWLSNWFVLSHRWQLSLPNLRRTLRSEPSPYKSLHQSSYPFWDVAWSSPFLGSRVWCLRGMFPVWIEDRAPGMLGFYTSDRRKWRHRAETRTCGISELSSSGYDLQKPSFEVVQPEVNKTIHRDIASKLGETRSNWEIIKE